MTPSLKAAVRTAGIEQTAFTAALLLTAGEAALAEHDAACLLYSALCGVLRRADETDDAVDSLLIGAVNAATERQPDAVHAVKADLQATDDNLAWALAGELSIAAHDAAEQTAAMVRDLAALDSALDDLDPDHLDPQ